MEVLLGRPDGTLDRTDAWQQGVEIRQVVARMVDGELVPLGTAPSRESALVLARKVIAELESPTGAWPLVGERLLRPDAIVSIDVMRPR